MTTDVSGESEDKNPICRLASRLYGCVYMTELIAREIQA